MMGELKLCLVVWFSCRIKELTDQAIPPFEDAQMMQLVCHIICVHTSRNAAEIVVVIIRGERQCQLGVHTVSP